MGSNGRAIYLRGLAREKNKPRVSAPNKTTYASLTVQQARFSQRVRRTQTRESMSNFILSVILIFYVYECISVVWRGLLKPNEEYTHYDHSTSNTKLGVAVTVSVLNFILAIFAGGVWCRRARAAQQLAFQCANPGCAAGRGCRTANCGSMQQLQRLQASETFHFLILKMSVVIPFGCLFLANLVRAIAVRSPNARGN